MNCLSKKFVLGMMKHNCHNWIILFFSLFMTITLHAGDVHIFLLKNNQAFIQEERVFPVEKGIRKIRLSPLPKELNFSRFFILPMTDGVTLNAIEKSAPSISLGKLLQRNLNKRVRILMDNGQYVSGWLIDWFNSGKRLYLKTDQNQPLFVEVELTRSILFEEDSVFFRSQDFYSYYDMEVASQRKCQAQFEFGYLVDDMNWGVEYMALLNENEDQCLLLSWLYLNNRCGMDFPTARIHLLVGEPYIYTDYSRWYSSLLNYRGLLPGGIYEDYEVKDLVDFKLISLKRPIHLPVDNHQKITLFPARSVNVKKEYWMPVSGNPIEVNAWININNSKEDGLGFVLPSGMFQIYKTHGTRKVYITSKEIENTHVNGEINLALGKVEDIDAVWHTEKVDSVGKDSLQVKYELRITNKKDKPVTINVIVKVFQETPLEIVRIADKYAVLSSRRLFFTVDVPAHEEKVVNYTILEMVEKDDD